MRRWRSQDIEARTKIKPNKNDGLTMTGNAWNWEMLVRRVKFVEFPHGEVDIQPEMIGFC